METPTIQFKIEKKGYSPIQVEEYIKGLMNEYDKLTRELKKVTAEKTAVEVDLNAAKKEIDRLKAASMDYELRLQNTPVAVPVPAPAPVVAPVEVKPPVIVQEPLHDEYVAKIAEYEKLKKELEAERAVFNETKAKAVVDGYMKGEAIASDVKEKAHREAEEILTKAKIARGNILFERNRAMESLQSIIANLNEVIDNVKNESDGEINVDGVGR